MGGEQDIRKMGGLSGKLKITYATFLIGCLAIAGLPPLSGFFSKDAILLSAFLHQPLQYGIALFTAFLTAFYMFRLLFLTFHGSFRGTPEQQAHLHESPALMTIPLVILAILSVAGGWIGIPAVLLQDADWLGNFLAPVLGSTTHEVSHATEWLLMSLSVGGVLLTIGFAWFLFRHYRATESRGILRFFENKWYVDQLYDRVIVQPIFYLGRILKEWVEPRIIDALVNGVGKTVQSAGRQIRFLQSGQIGSYVLLMVMAMVVVLLVQFFIRK